MKAINAAFKPIVVFCFGVYVGSKGGMPSVCRGNNIFLCRISEIAELFYVSSSFGAKFKSVRSAKGQLLSTSNGRLLQRMFESRTGVISRHSGNKRSTSFLKPSIPSRFPAHLIFPSETENSWPGKLGNNKGGQHHVTCIRFVLLDAPNASPGVQEGLAQGISPMAPIKSSVMHHWKEPGHSRCHNPGANLSLNL